MTIATKPVSQEKKDNEDNKIKDATINMSGVVTAESEIATGPPHDYFYADLRRRRVLTQLCIGLLILWLFMAAIIGGFVVHKYFAHKRVFHGWCGAQFRGENGASKGRYFQERVEVDPSTGLERIEVPKFGFNRPAVFIHDFRQNITAIVDRFGDQCFIRELDRKHMAHPQSFVDLVQKMEKGYYDLDPEVVREEYRVRVPSLTQRDIDDLESTMVIQYCTGKQTYWLQKQYTAVQRFLKKRSTGNCLEFAEINGKLGVDTEVMYENTVCFE